MKKLVASTLILVIVLVPLLVPISTADVQSASTWDIQTVDSTGVDVGRYSSLALDSNNYPHISYYDYDNGDLKYARWTGSAWSRVTVDSTGDVGMYTSLVLDSFDYPHISYYDASNGDLKYAHWNGSAWSRVTVDTTGDVGWCTSLALDSNDNPHISYDDNTNDDLKYAHWNGSAWSRVTVDTTGEYGDFSSIALDSSDNPHISYYNYTYGDLKYARWTGLAWNIVTVDSTGDVGMYTSLALDSSDNPHISYYDGTGYVWDLKYAQWNGSAWSIETVQSSVDSVGRYSSLALDSSDNPHISYYAWISSDDLRYAAWNGSAWNIETVDSTGDVGMYTSLALDSFDYPHISYYDASNGYLKYAFVPGPQFQYSFKLNPFADVISMNLSAGGWLNGIDVASYTAPILGKYENGKAYIACDLPAGGVEMYFLVINTATRDGYMYRITDDLSLIGPTYVWLTTVSQQSTQEGQTLNDVVDSEVTPAAWYSFIMQPWNVDIDLNTNLSPGLWGYDEYSNPVLGYTKGDRFFYAVDFLDSGGYSHRFMAGSISTRDGYSQGTYDGLTYGLDYFWLTTS